MPERSQYRAQGFLVYPGADAQPLASVQHHFQRRFHTVPADAAARSTKAKRTGCGWFRSRLRQ